MRTQIKNAVPEDLGQPDYGANPTLEEPASQESDLDGFNLDDIDFEEVEKRNAELIQQMDEDVPEADNDCGDACKI